MFDIYLSNKGLPIQTDYIVLTSNEFVDTDHKFRIADYDAIGNPLNWNGIISLSWDGRKLEELTVIGALLI